jgi:hypothetical protein
MSRRDLITMTTDEVRVFLEEQRVVTIGPNGRPHLVPECPECDVRLVEEQAGVARIGAAVAARYSGHNGPEVDALVAARAVKRVGLRVAPTSVPTWDHRKWSGTC